MAIIKAGDGKSDPILSRMVAEDRVPWYKKPNLRIMYIYLFLCCMGVEMTSGFDSQLINTLQFSGPFNKCTKIPYNMRDNKDLQIQTLEMDMWTPRPKSSPSSPQCLVLSPLATSSAPFSQSQLLHGSISDSVDDGRSWRDHSSWLLAPSSRGSLSM